MAINKRQQLILKAIIENYIATTEPVSSKTLIQSYPLELSAATVRNVMADLEAEGYLEQPHISSGRLPSDKGYREYVDHLLPESKPNPDWQAEVTSELNQNFTEVLGMVRKASELMTKSTGYTSLVLSPRFTKSRLAQMKMLMIEPGRVLVVLVLDPGIVKDRLINIPSEINAETLQKLAMNIEQSLAGRSIDEITWITVSGLGQGVTLPDALLNQVLFEAYTAIKQSDNLDTYVEGLQNVLNYPEFKDSKKAKAVLDLMTKDGILAGYLAEANEFLTDSLNESIGKNTDFNHPTGSIINVDETDSGLTMFNSKRPNFMVRIGQEIAFNGLEDCSFVTTTYQVGPNLIGHIGIVGPKRMDYSKVISEISFIRHIINKKMLE